MSENSVPPPPPPPKVFISYAHGDDAHNAWVWRFATDLHNQGIKIIYDKWDLSLGSDLPSFVESGLTGADRILVICTERYVQKANEGIGGVGFEKMILTSEIFKNIKGNRVIPVIRDSERSHLTPTFLASKIYIDFRDESAYAAKFDQLWRDICGQTVVPLPILGMDASPGKRLTNAISGTVWNYQWSRGTFEFCFDADGKITQCEPWDVVTWKVVSTNQAVLFWNGKSPIKLNFSENYERFITVGWNGEAASGFPVTETD